MKTLAGATLTRQSALKVSRIGVHTGTSSFGGNKSCIEMLNGL
ncbi:hypothetical protein [Prosthecobacter sp.]